MNLEEQIQWAENQSALNLFSTLIKEIQKNANVTISMTIKKPISAIDIVESKTDIPYNEDGYCEMDIHLRLWKK